MLFPPRVLSSALELQSVASRNLFENEMKILLIQSVEQTFCLSLFCFFFFPPTDGCGQAEGFSWGSALAALRIPGITQGRTLSFVLTAARMEQACFFPDQTHCLLQEFIFGPLKGSFVFERAWDPSSIDLAMQVHAGHEL